MNEKILKIIDNLTTFFKFSYQKNKKKQTILYNQETNLLYHNPEILDGLNFFYVLWVGSLLRSQVLKCAEGTYVVLKIINLVHTCLTSLLNIAKCPRHKWSPFQLYCTMLYKVDWSYEVAICGWKIWRFWRTPC